MYADSHRLIPKDPTGPLMVIFIGRISTPHQSMEAVEASFADDEQYLKQIYTGPTFIRRFGERASGWKVNRRAINQAMALIEGGTIDLVIMEDLGRAYRNPQFQYRIAHLCKDHRTRLICPGDGLDTADPNWEITMGAAVLRHSAHVPDTRRRVKRSATHAFNGGGMVGKVRAFYRRVDSEEAAANGGLRIAKLPEFAGTVAEMRAQVLRGHSYESIARWLTSEGIPPGEYATSGEWTGRLVQDFLRDPILRGLRTFRDVEHELIYATGDHRRVPNANPLTQDAPELAFMTAEEHAELLEVMDDRKGSRKRRQGSRRKNVPRKESYWPGQHLTCACCGETAYWYSDTDLKCRNVFPGRPERCWNRVLVDAEQVRRKLLPRLLEELRSRPKHYEVFVDSMWKEFQSEMRRGTRDEEHLRAEITEQEREVAKITALLLKADGSESLLSHLKRAESNLKALRKKESIGAKRPPPDPRFSSRERMMEHLDDAVLHLSRTSFPFSTLMRESFPDFHVVPVMAVGTAQVRPRIKFTVPADPEHGRPAVEIVVDAFDRSLPIQYAKACKALKDGHPEWTLVRIGEELGISKKAVYDSLRYEKVLEAAGVDEPFVELTERPAEVARWKKPKGSTGLPSDDSGDEGAALDQAG